MAAAAAAAVVVAAMASDDRMTAKSKFSRMQSTFKTYREMSRVNRFRMHSPRLDLLK